MAKLFYTISEVADNLGETVSLVRFWSNNFPRYVKPQRNAKGNRLYTESDIEALKQIHYLVKTKGMTLEGAAAQMGADHSSTDRSVKALESLREIRRQLVEIKKGL